jgi:hypothetical protein
MTMRTLEPPAVEMTGTATLATQERGGRRADDPADSIRFDWVNVVLGSWLVGGVHLDGWAHNHHPDLETFFTPWHGVLYSGFLALFLTLLFTFARNLGRGYARDRALPRGYNLSLAGGCIFLVGGVLDALWHIAFGIERSTEALLSPTHLMLATGGILMISGPLRAAWQRPTGRAASLAALLPALLALALVVAMLAFFTQFAHPQVNAWATLSRASARGTAASYGMTVDLGAASVLLQATILAAATLFVVRRWAPPFGSFALLFGLPSILISFMHDHYAFIPAAFLAGIAADALARRLQPAPHRPQALHLFAFAAPALFYSGYFATLALRYGIGWTIHLWLGAIFMAGIVGLLLSYLVAPTAIPQYTE